MQPDAQSWQSTAGDAARRTAVARETPFSWLAEPRIILGLIGAYLLGHLALRLTLSPTLGIDDAEQILFAQHWAFGYRFRQPPLFTWMLVPVANALGPGVLAVSLVRYALLAVTFAFLYLTARLCLDDQRIAGLAGLSFTLIYVFAYYAHHDLTHTTALSAMIALALYSMARLARSPSWHAYLLLGAVFGFGMLAKWNFAMLAVGLPLACLALPACRRLVLTWKSALSVAVMAVIVAPTALWMFAHGQSIQGVSGDILAGASTADGTALRLDGLQALLRSILLFPLPFLPMFLVLFGRNLRSTAEARDLAAGPPLPPAFFGWLMLIVLGLHVLLIPVFGAVNFTERWLHPALMPLPIFLLALAERGRPSPRQIAAFLALVVILVAAAATARLYRYSEGVHDCGSCREFAPFVELAEGLREAGFSRGTIVADGMHIGGNLRMIFADSRVIDPAFPLAVWPNVVDRAPVARNRDEPGACLLVWRDDGDRPTTRRDHLQAFAARELGLSSTMPATAGRLDAPLIGSSTRRYALGFALYRENVGGCR